MLVDSGVLPPDIDKVPVVLIPRMVALLMVRGLWRTVVVRAKAEIHGSSKLVCPGSPESAQSPCRVAALKSLPDDRREHELLRLAFVLDFFGQGSWSSVDVGLCAGSARDILHIRGSASLPQKRLKLQERAELGNRSAPLGCQTAIMVAPATHCVPLVLLRPGFLHNLQLSPHGPMSLFHVPPRHRKDNHRKETTTNA